MPGTPKESHRELVSIFLLLFILLLSLGYFEFFAENSLTGAVVGVVRNESSLGFVTAAVIVLAFLLIYLYVRNIRRH